jgi:hypothetical protein
MGDVPPGTILAMYAAVREFDAKRES